MQFKREIDDTAKCNRCGAQIRQKDFLKHWKKCKPTKELSPLERRHRAVKARDNEWRKKAKAKAKGKQMTFGE